MGDRSQIANFIQSLIVKAHPHAESLLELACGTGAILFHLRKGYSLAGLDLSGAMLAIAKKKLPAVPFYKKSMNKFSLGKTFDVIICVFDSINHLLHFSEWEDVFDRAASHLSPNGAFIFDMNTERKLKLLASRPSLVQQLGKNTLVMDVHDKGRRIFSWDIKVFEHQSGMHYHLSEERILERTFPQDKVRASLLRKFSTVICIDPERRRPSSASKRLYFVCGK